MARKKALEEVKNVVYEDGSYYDYNIGDLIMVEDKRQSGDKYIEVGIIVDKQYDEYYKDYQLSYVRLSTGTCDYGYNTIAGTIDEIDKQVIKHLPKECIDEYR